MDRRQKKSRDAIFQAFGALLEQQSYSKITVQQIIDAANVGRTTFYAHFETKDALLRELCIDLFEHVFSDRPEAESSHNFSLTEGDPQTVVTHILYHLRDRGRNLSRLMTGESSEAFLHYFRAYLDQVVSSYILAHMSEHPAVPVDFLQNHISGSFVNMVQWWFQGGMRETPEELGRYFLSVIQPII